LAFDFKEFEKNSEYLKKWQVEHKEEMKKLKAELKENQAKMAIEQREMQNELREIQREAMEEARVQAREAQAQARVAQRQVQKERAAMIAEGAKAREYEVQRIMRDRQKVKIKKTLRIKVPRNAKLEMDVDFCKISTIK